MSQAKRGIASSSGWKFKSAKLELKSRCTSLIIKLNQPSEKTASGGEKFSPLQRSYINSVFLKKKKGKKEFFCGF